MKKTFYFLLLSICLPLYLSTCLLAANFTKVPVYGGDISVAAMCPSSPTVIYAGSTYSGTFVTRDGAATWTAVGSIKSLGAQNDSLDKIAVHPVSPNIVIGGAFGSFATDIYRSVDYGTIWTKVGTEITSQNVNVTQIAASPSAPDTFYLLGQDFTNLDGVVYKSIDAGLTWTKTAFTSGNKIVSDLCVDKDNNVYVSIGDKAISSGNTGPQWESEFNGWIKKSSNGGDTWNTVLTLTAAPRYLATSSNTLAVSTLQYGNDKGVHISTNAGASFKKVTGQDKITVSPDGTKIYMTKMDGFAIITSSTTGWNDAVLIDSNSYVLGGYVLIDPANPNTMYMVGNNSVGLGNDDGIMKSTDTGFSWKAANSGLAGLVANAGCKDPNGDIYVLSSMCVYKGTVNGTVWKRVFSPDLERSYSSTNKHHKFSMGGAVAAPEVNNVFVGSAGDLYRSTDTGITWNMVYSTSVTTGDELSFSALVFNKTNPAIGYFSLKKPMSATSATIYKTTNYGSSTTWTQLGLTSDNAVQTLAIDPTNPTIIYAGLGNSPMYSSNWTYGGIWKIIDDGTNPPTWSQIGLADYLPYKITVSSDGIIMASCHDRTDTSTYHYNGATFYSKDSGVTWSKVYVYNMSSTPNALDIKWSDGVYYLASSEGVYATVDPSVSFQQVATSTDLGTIRCLIVGSMYSGANKGIYRLNWTGVTTYTGSASFTLYNYPNPFNPKNGKTVIKFGLRETAEKLTLKIYSMSGDLITEDRYYNYAGGNSYTFEWDGKNQKGELCAPGVYFVVADADGEKVKNKIVLVR
ncbi:MAG: hypothetical protein A2539_09310 [Elusimicrobia bacterium RIFOXYD2_FULL_34_15]|nr:MAG: hypothetical protein A2539_09310 [Elusimicrobia bacterium RIFOXYD2_FULL_34_15]